MDDSTRKFQVIVRVDADSDLTNDQWDEVSEELGSNIADIYLSSVEDEGYCDECGQYEEQTIDVSISNVNVTLPDPVRAEVIGLPK